jgi:uncharacterized membrane protein (DUF485 family)
MISKIKNIIENFQEFLRKHDKFFLPLTLIVIYSCFAFFIYIDSEAVLNFFKIPREIGAIILIILVVNYLLKKIYQFIKLF